jgi:hypothetical protein
MQLTTENSNCLIFHIRSKCMQASSLFDPYTFNGFMQVLKRMAAPPTAQQQQQQQGNDPQPTQEGATQGATAAGAKRRGGAAANRKKPAAASSSDEGDDDDDQDEDMDGGGGGKPRPRRVGKAAASGASGGGGGPGACLDCLLDLSAFVRVFPLKDHQEMLAMMIETMVELARCTMAVAGRGGGGGGAGGARAKVLRPSAAGERAVKCLHTTCILHPACQGNSKPQTLNPIACTHPASCILHARATLNLKP